MDSRRAGAARAAGADPDVRDWLGFLSFERGLSKRTRDAYAGDIAGFAEFLRERRGGAAPDWAAVRTDDVSGWVADCVRRGDVASTRARRLVAVKGFFAYLRGEGRIEVDPAAILSQPRRPRVLPHSVSREEAARLLEAPSPDTPEGLRDRALLEVLYGCGLRESEAARLPLLAVRFGEGTLRIRGKGNKERVVPLGSRAEEALRAWLERGRPAFRPAVGEPHVFLGAKGRPMGRESVWRAVKKHAAAAGLPPTVSPHWLRHSFATHMLSGGAPIRVIQELLGHADIGTTQAYTHVDASRLSSIVGSFHPRA